MSKMNWKKTYRGRPFKEKFEGYRWHFFAWMMNKHPKAYTQVERLFPKFSLPF